MPRLKKVYVYVLTTELDTEVPPMVDGAKLLSSEVNTLRTRIAKYINDCRDRRHKEAADLQTRLNELEAE